MHSGRASNIGIPWLPASALAASASETFAPDTRIAGIVLRRRRGKRFLHERGGGRVAIGAADSFYYEGIGGRLWQRRSAGQQERPLLDSTDPTRRERIGKVSPVAMSRVSTGATKPSSATAAAVS